MKVKNNIKLHRTLLYNYVEELGGELFKVCDTNSTYYMIGDIKVRFSDHIGHNKGFKNIDIVFKDNYFLCVYEVDFKIFHKISDVKKWISNIIFSIKQFQIYIINYHKSNNCEVTSKLNSRITKLEKELNQYKLIDDAYKKLKTKHDNLTKVHEQIVKKNRNQSNEIKKLQEELKNK